jgi:hypothetical protein
MLFNLEKKVDGTCIITPMNFTMTNKFPRKYQFTPKIDYLDFFLKDKDIVPM